MGEVVVFGASGFVGSNLIHSYPTMKGISIRDLNWRSQLYESNSEVVINLIGKAHDHKGTSSKEDYHYANVSIVKEIFNEFLTSNAKLFIHISSLAALEEYSSSIPLVESDDCHPESWYGISKREAEEWLLNQGIPEEKKVIILRPPMIHGPGDKGNLGLLYNLISRGIPYPLSSFNNRRSFIAIDNFIFFIDQIIKKREKLDSGLYHISDNEYISTNEIISIIKEVTGKNVLNINFPKFLIKLLADIGDVIPIPLNNRRLKKMTSDLIVSNNKIKQAINIVALPLSAKEGLVKTVKSFHTSSVSSTVE